MVAGPRCIAAWVPIPARGDKLVLFESWHQRGCVCMPLHVMEPSLYTERDEGRVEGVRIQGMLTKFSIEHLQACNPS